MVRERSAGLLVGVVCLALLEGGCSSKDGSNTHTAGLNETSGGEDISCAQGVPSDTQYCFGVHTVPDIVIPNAAAGGELDESPGEHFVVLSHASRQLVTVSFAASELVASEPVAAPTWKEIQVRLADVDEQPGVDVVLTSLNGPNGYLSNLGENFGLYQEFSFPDLKGYGRISPIDVDGDGKAELLKGHDKIARLWKSVEGTWTLQEPSFEIPNCYALWDSVVIDVNSDGASDVAFIGSPFSATTASEFCEPPPDHGIKVLLSGLQSSLLQEVAFIPIAANINDIVSGDFDGDGIVDLAVSSQQHNRVVALKGVGDGQFTPTLMETEGYRVLSGDFDGDGIDEIALNRRNAEAVTVEIWLIDDVLASRTETLVPGISAGLLAVADVNADGVDDIAAKYLTDGPSHLLVLVSEPG